MGDRARRIHALWSWLPAFRAVGETQHLPTASEELGVSASALSRSIKLLEDEVGQPLFDRVGRNIQLNAAGEKLLDAVRDAMRHVDEGLSAVAEGQHVGPVRISVPGPFASVFVMPALARIAKEHPGLVPVMVSQLPAEIPEMLRRGRLDLALVEGELPTRELVTDRLCTITHGVYCGPDHPLRPAKNVTLEQLARHAFCAPTEDVRRIWPPNVQRNVVMRATQMQLGIEACQRSELLAVLPDLVARPAGLHRLPYDDFVTTTLYVVRRPPLPTMKSRADVVVDAIREVAAEIG